MVKSPLGSVEESRYNSVASTCLTYLQVGALPFSSLFTQRLPDTPLPKGKRALVSRLRYVGEETDVYLSGTSDGTRVLHLGVSSNVPP